MTCARCGHEILPGQLWRRYPVWDPREPAHISCPSAREVERAHLWGRWL